MLHPSSNDTKCLYIHIDAKVFDIIKLIYDSVIYQQFSSLINITYY